MCGICGYVSEQKLDIRAMTQSIHHRGPDAQAVLEEGAVALGHARLSIIDLSTHANQPMTSRSVRYVIVYNGEVYNFRELKAELEKAGCTFSTQSDTEVILEGFERWGLDFLEKLNGMFAFAIYDKKEKTIHLVRDRYGIKPLYYYLNGRDLVFGSEIKALLASDLIEKKLNYQGLHEYLHFSTTLGETTFYSGVKKLLPGHFMSYDVNKRQFKTQSYKNNYDMVESKDSLEDAIVRIRELFEQSVKRQLIADVPVGIFLSGGIDSTAITAFASRHYTGTLKTFSSGFDYDKGVNELPNARFIAEKFGTNHHELHIKGGDIPHVLEELNGYFDQPFGDAANIPLFLMSRQLGGNHKVILQGDGGDELFAGYGRYFRVANERAFRLLSKVLVGIAPLIPKSSKRYRTMRSMYAVAQKDPTLVTALIMSQEMWTEPPTRLFKNSWRDRLEQVDPFARYKELHGLFGGKDLLQELLFTDTNAILPDLYFEKVDLATMAASIEVRVPFLDNDLAAYAMSLPSRYKVQGKEKKYLLKKAFAGVVPDRILYGPKRGFSVPFQHWLRTSMKEFMVDTIRASDCYSPEVDILMGQHITGKQDHGFMLWKLLNLSMWLRANEDITV